MINLNVLDSVFAALSNLMIEYVPKTLDNKSQIRFEYNIKGNKFSGI